MAKTTEDMITEFKSFISYAAILNELDEKSWNTPIAEGKWTLKDVIGHMMLWDKYYYEEGIARIKDKQPVTVKHLNFDEFNAGAIDYAKSQSKRDMYTQFVACRTKIIDDISGLTEEEYVREYTDGDKKKFSIRKYLRGFISHDKHHKKQIEKWLKNKPSD